MLDTKDDENSKCRNEKILNFEFTKPWSLASPSRASLRTLDPISEVGPY